MSFSETNPAVNVERVVGAGGLFGDGDGGRMGELVAGRNDEGAEAVLRVELRSGRSSRAAGGTRGGLGLARSFLRVRQEVDREPQ